jgi:hypothetical protein
VDKYTNKLGHCEKYTLDLVVNEIQLVSVEKMLVLLPLTAFQLN